MPKTQIKHCNKKKERALERTCDMKGEDDQAENEKKKETKLRSRLKRMEALLRGRRKEEGRRRKEKGRRRKAAAEDELGEEMGSILRVLGRRQRVVDGGKRTAKGRRASPFSLLGEERFVGVRVKELGKNKKKKIKENEREADGIRRGETRVSLPHRPFL